MQYVTMDAALLKKCFLAAAANIEKNKEYINELNVFPVPDGDTGTNVSMTLMSAAQEVSGTPEKMFDVCRAISQGTLRGARGNSGVIFSQLLRGFTKTIREKETVTAEDLAAAFVRAKDTAYKAVMKPKEGTILTVARGMSEKIVELAPSAENITDLINEVVRYGGEVLDRTPEMLPVLKEAGVVDSGGMALMEAIRGAAAVLSGTDGELLGKEALPQDGGQPVRSAQDAAGHVHISTDDIKFGYCTECIVNLKDGTKASEVEELKKFLLSMGDSVVCVEDDGIVKVHVHTNHPGLVFEKGLELGSLSRLKVDNLHEEHAERLEREAAKAAEEQKAVRREPSKEKAIVCVCAGAELAEMFRELGADVVIEGGQTMNPSIQDILDAAEKADAKEVYVLPNNKNIILASQQAGQNTDGRFEIITVPTRTVVQGLTAVMNFDPGLSSEANQEIMKEAVAGVKSGEVTYSIRSTTIDGFEIREGDIMGIGDHGMLAAGKDLNEVTLEMIGKMTDEETSLISVYYGEEVDDARADELLSVLSLQYPMADVDVRRGGQPVYYYFISVE